MATMAQLNALIVVRSDVAALSVAAAVWDAAVGMNVGNAVDEAQQRLLKRHARELLELHSVDAGSILRTYRNGDAPPHADPPTYDES